MKKIKLLGIPFDFGQDEIGVRLASHHLKENGLLTRLNKLTILEDLGDLSFPYKVSHKDEGPIKYCKSASEGGQLIYERIKNLNLNDSFLLNVGGDHGMSFGTVQGILAHYPETVVIWADAHGDINTPSSTPSGNFHGMPLAFLLEEAKDPSFNWTVRRLLPRKLILIGPRDLDQGEVEIIHRLGIQYFSSDELNQLGAKDVLEMALHRVDPMGKSNIHLSFDVDIFDQKDIASTGTIVEDGPRMEEVFLLGGLIAQTGRLKSMDVVEFNPLLGSEKEVASSCGIILDFMEMVVAEAFESQTEKSNFRLPRIENFLEMRTL